MAQDAISLERVSSKLVSNRGLDFFTRFTAITSETDSFQTCLRFAPFLQLKQKVIIHTGDPGEGICKIVAEYKPIMVIMGSRGLNLIRRTFMGSVSSYVLHHVDIPVVIVPAPGQ